MSVLVWDMLDHLPIGYDIPWAVHAVLFAYGVALLDNALLEPLATACGEEGRDEFMLVIAPLRVVGGRASPRTRSRCSEPGVTPMMAPAGRQLARDPVMRALIRRHGPCELAPHGRSPYEALSRAIAHQQLNGRAAETILGRFVALFPNGRFPAPAAVLAARTTTLRRAGFSRAKVRALKDIARRVPSGRPPEWGADGRARGSGRGRSRRGGKARGRPPRGCRGCR